MHCDLTLYQQLVKTLHLQICRPGVLYQTSNIVYSYATSASGILYDNQVSLSNMMMTCSN